MKYWGHISPRFISKKCFIKLVIDRLYVITFTRLRSNSTRLFAYNWEIFIGDIFTNKNLLYIRNEMFQFSICRFSKFPLVGVFGNMFWLRQCFGPQIFDENKTKFNSSEETHQWEPDRRRVSSIWRHKRYISNTHRQYVIHNVGLNRGGGSIRSSDELRSEYYVAQ